MTTELQLIYEACCKTTGFNLSDRSRKKEVSYARIVFFHYARERTTESLDAIGKMVARDHSTVLHGVKKYQEYIEYTDFKNISDKIKKALPKKDIENLTHEEREIKMLYSNKLRMERQIAMLQNKLTNEGLEFLEEIKELPKDLLQEFRDYKWMPHKKMLESREVYKFNN